MIRAGQRLRETRIKKRLTLEEVASATRIRVSFLQAIEKDEYKKLPSPAYASGFVSNYAQFLGLNKGEILALFRREFDEERELQVLPKGFSKKPEIKISRFRLAHTAIGIGVLCLLLFGYLFVQYRGAFVSPSLSVLSPVQGAVTSQTIQVAGKTDPNASVMVNGNSAVVGDDGSFQKNLTAFPGEMTIVITATNRMNKQTTIKRDIDVKGNG